MKEDYRKQRTMLVLTFLTWSRRDEIVNSAWEDCYPSLILMRWLFEHVLRRKCVQTNLSGMFSDRAKIRSMIFILFS